MKHMTNENDETRKQNSITLRRDAAEQLSNLHERQLRTWKLWQRTQNNMKTISKSLSKLR